jgi:hypothetical protein
MKTLPLDKIRTDGGTQLRAKMDDAVVDEYRDAVVGGAKFPPVTVFFDGEDHWLADGFYRLAARKKAGLASIPVDVKKGTQREAMLYAAGANANHGLRRTNADRERAVKMLLADEEWGAKSDRWIAEQAAVSHPYVAKVRKKLSAEIGKRVAAALDSRAWLEDQVSTVDTSNGQVETVTTSNGDGEAGESQLETFPVEETPPSQVGTFPPEKDDRPAPKPAKSAKRVGKDGKKYRIKPQVETVTTSNGDGNGDPALVLDGLKRPVPEKFREVFEARRRFQEATLLLTRAARIIEELVRSEAGANLQEGEVLPRIRKVKEAVHTAMPHAVCPYCQGEDRKPTCKPCEGLGWVDKVTYKAAPKDGEEVKG